MKIKIHPLFIVYAVLIALLERSLAGVWTFIAVSAHETGHAIVAKSRGYVVNSLTLLPFGAVMSSDEKFDRTSAVLIGLAGPCVNAVLALLLLGIWWLFPSLYSCTEIFLYANVTLCVFNLLPVFPLDGSKVVLGFAKNRMKAVKGMKIAGVIVSVMMLAGFVASCFFHINFSLGIMAIFLFYGAVFDAKDKNYLSVFSPLSKDYAGGVEKRTIIIDGGVPIARLFRFVSENTETTFLIKTGNGQKSMSESELSDIAVANKIYLPIERALEKRAD